MDGYWRYPPRAPRLRVKTLFELLVVFVVVVFAPEARIFVEECERVERLHAIEKEDAVEVVGFVLNNAARQARRL